MSESRNESGSGDSGSRDTTIAGRSETGVNDTKDPIQVRPVAAILGEMAPFAGVPGNALDSVLPLCEIRNLRQGEVLLSPGQPNHHIYVVLSGRLRVHIDRIDSSTTLYIGPGEYVGEISIIDGRPPSAFVVADEAAEVLAVPEQSFWEHLLTIPQVNRNFMRLLANRFRANNQAVQRALEQELRLEQIHRELAIARDIQTGMLPQDLTFAPEIEIAAAMTPAQEIGGDFYDAFPLGEGACCVVIADVSGKGIPAALFMARTMAILRAEVLRDQPLEEAVSRLNVQLCEDNPTCMFATLAAATVDFRTGVCRYVSAGHDPMVLGADGAGFSALAPSRGILVGVNPSASYASIAFTLQPRDTLLLYTDGVTEAMNPRGELFTRERLMAVLQQAERGCASTLVSHVQDAVLAFAAGAAPADDLTLVVIRYLGSANSPDGAGNG